MNLRFLALPTEAVRALQAGGPDANGQLPEVMVSDGSGNPCRHCLRDIPTGESMLILAYRPFPTVHPYAETGPIFLCAEPCERHPETSELPELFKSREIFLLRGYGADDRILYGTGQVVETRAVMDTVAKLLEQSDTAYVHMRSASYNCFLCRIERW